MYKYMEHFDKCFIAMCAMQRDDTAAMIDQIAKRKETTSKVNTLHNYEHSNKSYTRPYDGKIALL